MATASSHDLLNKSWLSIRWNKLLDVIGDDPTMLSVFGTSFVIFMAFWMYGSIFSFVDLTNRPRWMLKYKIQPNKNVPISRRKFWMAVIQVLFNQLVTNPLFLYIYHSIYFKLRAPNEIRQLPTLSTFLIHIGIMVFLEEPLFYYAHRFLHHPSIYKHIHKQHHEWTSSVAIITFYCHPVEHILCNMGPLGWSFALLNSHVTVIWAVTFMFTVNSMNDHTGYSFPFPFYRSTVVLHDIHHAKSNCNFGMFNWCDKLHGTYVLPEKYTDKGINNKGSTTTSKKIK